MNRSSSLGALGLVALAAACAPDFSTTRSPPARGTIGQELYGVVCDRIGAQALPEDLTGASFHSICHPDTTGAYTSAVDISVLPPSTATARDVNGNPVSVATQDANRTYAVNRIQALARRRPDFIASLDATFPAINLPAKDVTNSDPTKSCEPSPTNGGVASMSDQLTDLLARFQPLYNDGTIPQSTESLSRVFKAIVESPDAQTAFAHFEARQGYRPIDLTLGAARPAIAYSGLRDLSNAALALLSADSQPYNTSKVDSSGNRIPIPGPANPQLNALIAVAHDELLYSTPDATVPLLKTSTDSTVGRTILNRPRTDLEVLEALFYATNASYGNGGAPSFIALRDPRGVAQVAKINGQFVAPFQDADGDGLADIDALGQFITTDGSTAPSPFFAVGSAYGTRDTCGRAIRSSVPSVPGDAGGATSVDASTPLDASSVDASGASPISPVSADDAGSSSANAACGSVASGALLYNYVDTSNVFATALLRNLKPLANPDPTANHNTLMYALAGANVLFGKRDASTALTSKCYAPDPTNPSSCTDPASLLQYSAFQTDSAALLDLVYGLGQVLGDSTTDDTLAYVRQLFTSDVPDMARVAGDALAMKNAANADTTAKIPATSTFWDEMLDVTVQLEQEPGLLEDVLRSLGADGSQNLGTIFSNYMQFNDQISYNPTSVAAFNGPPENVTLSQGGTVSTANMQTAVNRAQPATGFNRSAFFRFLSLIHDTDNVTTCNEEGAIVHAQGLPLFGSADVCGSSNGNGALCSVPILDIGERPFHKCEVFKIENLAKFYLDSIVGAATINFRPPILQNGLCIGSLCIGASTVGMIEQSSDIGYDSSNAEPVNDTYGFWDPVGTTKKFRPRPQWLNRLVFFDQTTNTASTDPLYTTQHFLADLNGPHIGSSVCPIVPPFADPVPGATDADPNGMVSNMHDCTSQPTDWLDVRGKDTIFVWEQFNFYQSITPLLNAFISHGREDLFIDIMETLYRHWGDSNETADECLLSVGPTVNCTKDGLVTYEPLLATNFGGDILPALHTLEPTLTSLTIPHCTALDTSLDANGNPKDTCTAETTEDGIAVLSAATRALVDPVQAKAIGLKDRLGNVTALRNDGTTNPQVTPIYLLLEALNNMDAAFTTYVNPTPSDDRFAQWRLARSQLVDQFLTIDGSGGNSTFDNAVTPAVVPTLIDILREQLFAHCASTFAPPSTRCAWARDTFTTELTNVVHGPTFAGTMDVLDAMRLNADTNQQTGLLLQYLLDAASQNDALPNLLATSNDLIQVMKDDTNLVPLYNALASAFVATQVDAQGQITQKSVVDASLSLLGRISGRSFDANGTEICANELDPNQVMTVALQNLVTPMAATTSGGSTTPNQAPLQTIMDVIGDVNRADPSQTNQYAATDYANIANEVSDFMLSPTNGLEQFYEIVRLGTVK